MNILKFTQYIWNANNSGLLGFRVDAIMFMIYNTLQQRPFDGIHVVYKTFDVCPFQ